MSNELHTYGIISILKNSSYVLALFLGLDAKAFGILAAFMVLDTITGVIRSAYLHGGSSIRSHILAAGVLSKMLLILVPLVVAWAGEGVGLNLTSVAGAALSVFILSEAYSILGNIYAIHTKKELTEFDAVAGVLKGLRNLIERLGTTQQQIDKDTEVERTMAQLNGAMYKGKEDLSDKK